MKLYEITGVMRALMDTISDLPLNEDGKPLDENAQAEHDKAMAAFQDTSNDMRDKMRAMTAYALELRVEREARQAMIDAIASNVLDKMNKANQRDLRKEEWLLSQVQGSIQMLGVPLPLKFPEFTINLQKQPQSVQVQDESAIPSEYLRTIPAVAESTAPDKKKIAADIKEGVVIPGVTLSDVTYRMTIK
jgi:hypothetical protein